MGLVGWGLQAGPVDWGQGLGASSPWGPADWVGLWAGACRLGAEDWGASVGWGARRLGAQTKDLCDQRPVG